MIKQFLVVSALLVSGMGLAYASDPCADPQVVEQVKEQVICTEIVNCTYWGGWDKVSHMSRDEHRQRMGMKIAGHEGELILQNSYRMFIGMDHITSRIETIPVSYSSDVGRSECRMTIYWNMPVYKPILFSAIWASFLNKSGIALVMVGPDAGWTYLWNGLEFDRRVYDRTTVEYGIVGDKVDVVDTSQLIDDRGLND